jgi:hypothetical protein
VLSLDGSIADDKIIAGPVILFANQERRDKDVKWDSISKV